MRNLILFSFCFISSLSIGQLTGVDYLMKYNCETNQYDVNLVVLGGSATSVPHRAQFNSQISIVVPTGETVVLREKFMPIQNNALYTGTIPIDWYLGTPKIAPEIQPENDFYSVTPTLSPAAFYNDLESGDIVKLFSFTAGSTEQYDEDVRFFKNDVDPSSNQPGMGGGDFSNGFTIGGSSQIYNSNSEESCLTSIDNTLALVANVYPNPFQNQFTIDLPTDINSLQIINTEGKVYYESGKKTKGVLTVNAHAYPVGFYYTRIVFENGLVSSRRIIKL